MHIENIDVPSLHIHDQLSDERIADTQSMNLYQAPTTQQSE